MAAIGDPPAPGDDLDAVLDAARSGDPRAFERLYAEVAGPVAGYLRYNGASDVHGITNEVMAQAHAGLPAFEGGWLPFRAWLFTIAHHRMIDDRRRSARRPVIVMSEVTDAAGAPDAADEVIDLLSDERLLALLDGLSADQRDVLLLRIVADLPIAETARALGKTPGAVKSLQHRALATLRQHLEEEGSSRGAS